MTRGYSLSVIDDLVGARASPRWRVVSAGSSEGRREGLETVPVTVRATPIGAMATAVSSGVRGTTGAYAEDGDWRSGVCVASPSKQDLCGLTLPGARGVTPAGLPGRR